MGALSVASIAGPLSASSPSVPSNEWPDPQFCIQDQNLALPAFNDALTGFIAPIPYAPNTTGSNTVVCACSNTGALLVGSLVTFGAAADKALRLLGTQQLIFEITAIIPNVSFTVVGEGYRAVPTNSAPSTVQIVMRGAGSAYLSGNITSNLQRIGATLPIALISDRPAHIARFKGCRRVVVVQLVAAGQVAIYWQASGARFKAMQGTRRAVGLAVVVASGGDANAQAFINNGAIAPGGVIATSADRTWIGTTNLVGGVTYQAGALLRGAAGDIFALGEFTECGAFDELPDGSFSTPRGQVVRAIASVSPWIGETMTFPPGGQFDVNMRQASGGVINEGVSYMTGLLEGQCGKVGEILGPSMAQGAVIFSPWLHQLIDPAGHGGDGRYYAQAAGDFQLDDNAHIQIGGTPGNTFQYLSWDLSTFSLFVGP